MITLPSRDLILPSRHAKLRISGDFILRKLDANRRVIYESPDWIPNLFTNLGMDQIGAGVAFGSYLRIGTGSTAPANTDSSLVSQSASTSSIVAQTIVNNGSPNYETEATATFEFAMGAVVGNMAELGLAWSASAANNLATRALIVDGFGTPTTISVLVGEILQVVYRIKGYPILTDATGTVTIGGVSYNYVARGSGVANTIAIYPQYAWLGSVYSANAYNGALGTLLTAPAGTSTGLTLGSFAAYTNGTYYRDFSLSANIANGNLAGGISAIRTTVGGSIGALFNSQCSFDKTTGGGGIPKDNTKTFGITFRVSWARH